MVCRPDRVIVRTIQRHGLTPAPADVVKSRIMASGGAANAHAVIYSGTIDCLVKTVRTEGVLALWKGFLPCWGRLGPWQVWASA